MTPVVEIRSSKLFELFLVGCWNDALFRIHM